MAVAMDDSNESVSVNMEKIYLGGKVRKFSSVLDSLFIFLSLFYSFVCFYL